MHTNFSSFCHLSSLCETNSYSNNTSKVSIYSCEERGVFGLALLDTWLLESENKTIFIKDKFKKISIMMSFLRSWSFFFFKCQ